ncbi:hypothetical protein MMAD_05690 [Mycolicibacterium madagascariense]|uniref:Secreted protein n=1 Tax=Mycolicibacterium madagascariense TaxID=212765 RepID=A0A7I7X9M3_9MYCO|nr:hypothetical protein MMAD_05690 [Mycolicibacterium madagascariense]
MVLSLSVAVLGAVAGLVGAPSAAAACNDSSGTVVCAQGDVRGTHAAPPSRGTLGSYGSFCSGTACYLDGGLGVVLGP